jgi:hypothetical protein
LRRADAFFDAVLALTALGAGAGALGDGFESGGAFGDVGFDDAVAHHLADTDNHVLS